MKHKKLTLTLVGVLLTGCYSFNRLEFNDFNSAAKENNRLYQEVKKVAAVAIEEPAKRAKIICPLFSLPVLPKTPELPFTELSKVEPTDTVGIDKIQQKHIDDLRAYIIQLKHSVYMAQQEHNSKCFNEANEVVK
jgi:hypothetical protein